MLDALIERVRAALVRRAALAAQALPPRQLPALRAAPVTRPQTASATADAGFAADLLPAPDFPTSILETPIQAASPLLAAFATPGGLLAAIVASEALAPPLSRR